MRGHRSILFSTDKQGVTQNIITAKRKHVLKPCDITINNCQLSRDDKEINIDEHVGV